MKEYPISFTPALVQGLALQEEDSRKGQYLTRCLGLRPTSTGLALFNPVSYIAPVTATGVPPSNSDTSEVVFSFPPSHNSPSLWNNGTANFDTSPTDDGAVMTILSGPAASSGPYNVSGYLTSDYVTYNPPLPALTGYVDLSWTFAWSHPDLNFQIHVYYVTNTSGVSNGTALRAPALGTTYTQRLPLDVPEGTIRIYMVYDIRPYDGTTLPQVNNIIPIVSIQPCTLHLYGTTSEPEIPVENYVDGMQGQLFVTEDGNIYGVLNNLQTTTSELYKLDDEIATITVQSTYDPETLEENDIPTFNEKLNFETLGASWIMSNNAGTIFKLPSHIFATSTLKCNGMCKYKNRVIYGGISTTYDLAANANWMRIWNTWKTVVDSTQEAVGLTAFDNTYLMWGESNITGVGLVLDMVALGVIDDDTAYTEIASCTEYIIEAIKAGTMGFVRVPNIGSIQGVAPIKDTLVVAGTKGIAFLKPRQVEGKELSFYIGTTEKGGVYGSHAIGWNDDRVILLLTDRSVYTVTDESITFLGRLPSLAELDTNADPDFYPLGIFPEFKHKGFYVADGAHCYWIGQDKISEMGVVVTSAVILPHGEAHYIKKSIVAPYGDMDTDVQYARVVTNLFDMNLTALKTLCSVKVAYNGFASGQVRAKAWYAQSTSEVTTTDWVDLTPEGTAHIGLTGLFFQIEARFIVSTVSAHQHMLTDLTASWQLCDKRYIRGMYGNAALTPSDAG